MHPPYALFGWNDKMTKYPANVHHHVCNGGSGYCELYAVEDHGAPRDVDDDRGRLKASNVFFAPSFPSTLRLSLLFLLSSSTKRESTAREAIIDSWCRLFRMVGSFGVSGLRSGASLSPHYGSEHPKDRDFHFHSQTGLKRISFRRKPPS